MIIPCYLHSIYILASFTGYEDDIFGVISTNLAENLTNLAENLTNLAKNL